MNTIIRTLRAVFVFSILGVTTPCSGQTQNLVEMSFEQGNDTAVGDIVAEIGWSIRCVFQDSKSNIWFGTNGEGVFKYDGEIITKFTVKHGLSSNFVWNIRERKDGTIWFETNIQKGAGDVIAVCFFDGEKFTKIEVDEKAVPIDYSYLNDELLGGYYYNGKSLVKIQLPQTSPIRNDKKAPHFYDIYSTCKDRKGNLWFGTCGAGVCKYDGKAYTWLDSRELDCAVRSIFEDKNGDIWIGDNGYGLFRYDGKTIINFSKQIGLNNPDFKKYPSGKEGTISRVWTITDDKEGNLWIGTIDAGIWKYNGTIVTNYTTKDGLGIDFIWTIYKDKKDKLWFGTDGGGVYNFDGKSFIRFGGKER